MSPAPEPLFYHTTPQCPSVLTWWSLPAGSQHKVLLYLAEVIEPIDGEEVLFVWVPGDGSELGDEFLPLLGILHVLSDSCVLTEQIINSTMQFNLQCQTGSDRLFLTRHVLYENEAFLKQSIILGF